ncbi:uncharacterized protein L201_004179 [Kwoniella dendrophila CBS 6074]|uniref:PIN domain-containing protein n=1 Tax=Kwoniella dendrophila CBS 6074 TaxID=1295534 RepID=A0AAX4JWP5_9TREE
MEDPTPRAGPSRPRRPVDNNDIANKIFALQRKNASAVGNDGISGSRSSRRAESTERERHRNVPPQIGVLPPSGPSRLYPNPPSSPSRSSNPPRHPASPRKPHPSLRPSPDIDEYSRGPGPSSSNRALFDPSRSASSQQQVLPPIPRVDRSPRPIYEDEIPRRRLDSRRNGAADSQSYGQGQPSSSSSSKKLFDPSIHDPLHFSSHPHQNLRSTSNTPESSEMGSSSNRLLLRRPHTTRTPEEEADKERERRKRREGSERGSTSTSMMKKKDSDTRSKGSRSSEGSESFKDRERGKNSSDTGVKPILKKIHDEIKELESELIEIHRKMSNDPEAGIMALFDGIDGMNGLDMYSRSRKNLVEDQEAAAWIDLISKHKHLAELHDHFLITLYDPLVPPSYHQLSVKYNIPSRLWQTAFHLILERLRLAWMSGHPTALDLLTDVVYDAYRFYSELLENQGLSNFRTAWIEALGDLARYRMTIASHVQEGPSTSSNDNGSKKKLGRIDMPEEEEIEEQQPIPSGASIGAEVAQNWDVEDKETWRTTARDWYNLGINEKPGEGRLHHHLALLCRDVKGQEGRALHHFVKSLTVTHEYPTSRESILPLFDSALQNQRSLPEATAMDLFLRLHGMLFTRISLDDFEAVMSRFMERLEEDARLDGVSKKVSIGQKDWMIMASVCLGSVMQYGSNSGIVRKALSQEGAERRRAQALADNEDGEGEDGEPSQANEGLTVDGNLPQRTVSPVPMNGNGDMEDPQPITFTYALKLAFSIFEFVLAHPNRIQGFHQVLNPYITMFVTFIATLFRQPHIATPLLLSVPWERLIQFVNSANLEIVEEKRLAYGIPLPEDWLLRGNEWVGRRVYERGFWKTKSNSSGGGGRSSGGSMIVQPRPTNGGNLDKFNSEMDVLLNNFEPPILHDLSEGIIEDHDDDDEDDENAEDNLDGPKSINQRRWKRIIWSIGILLKYVDGLNIDGNNEKLIIEGTLKRKLDELQIEKDKQREEERRLEKRRLDRERQEKLEFELKEMDVEEEEEEEESDDDDKDDDQELAALRQRRRELQGLLSGPSAPSTKSTTSRSKNLKRSNIHMVPGYTMLLFDTNVLVDSLNLFSKIVESGQWTVIVPLPVVTELDGLSKEPGPLGNNSKLSITYLEKRIKTNSLTLKIQTTKGNYLNDLLIRTTTNESDTENERTMDDKIINIASFALNNFIDRSSLLKISSSSTSQDKAIGDKVVVISNDRNLRLMARSKGLKGINEKELQKILN